MPKAWNHVPSPFLQMVLSILYNWTSQPRNFEFHRGNKGLNAENKETPHRNIPEQIEIQSSVTPIWKLGQDLGIAPTGRHDWSIAIYFLIGWIVSLPSTMGFSHDFLFYMAHINNSD